MRPFIPISVALLLLCACTNLLDYRSGQSEELIIMNALLRTDETEHTVWLHRGLIDKVESLDDARLDCYINGSLAARAVRTDMKKGYDYPYSKYSFNAVICPGDEVRLEAASGKMHASATVTAPRPATLVAADTLTVTDSPYADVSTYSAAGVYDPQVKGRALSCRLTLRDLPGESNWYRLCATLDKEQQDHFPDHPEKDRTRHLRYEWYFGFDLDPILSDGYQSQEEGASSLIDPVYNYFCAFRDNRFADGEALVEIHLSPASTQARFAYYAGEEGDDENAVHTFHPRMILRLLTLSAEEYNYLSAISRGLSRGFDWNFLLEPVSFPSNVEGGLGLVSVASASDIILDYPTFSVEGALAPSESY